MVFHKDILKIDCAEVVNKLCKFISSQISGLRRDGAVVGMSGGVDSAVAAALCTKALGKDKVLGLILPETDSSSVSSEYALKHANELGIKTETIRISNNLASFGVYEKRDTAIKAIFPEFNFTYKYKIVLPPNIIDNASYNFYTLIIDNGKGKHKSARLDLNGFRQIVAATNVKQRTRMVQLYLAAEERNYIVCGTTNKSESIQGFFVKYGDGGVDIEPIENYYKVQVYQIAEYLGVPEEIIKRKPTPDTYSLEQSDEEFYFRIPYNVLDLMLYAWENKVPIDEVCKVMQLTETQVKRVFHDISAKYEITKHLRMMPPSSNQPVLGL